MSETKCNPATTAAICARTRAGLNREQAASLSGVNRKTVYRWLERAEKAAPADEENPYTAFAEALQLAEDEFEGRQLARIEEAAESPQRWTAAAWLLERRHPERWSLRNSRIQLLGADGETVTVNVSFTGTAKGANDGQDSDATAPDAT